MVNETLGQECAADASYFDTAKFSVTKMAHILRAKAVLCPDLKIRFENKIAKEVTEWQFEDGLKDYLMQAAAELSLFLTKNRLWDNSPAITRLLTGQ